MQPTSGNAERRQVMPMVAFDECAKHFVVSELFKSYVYDIVFSDDNRQILITNEYGNVDVFSWPGLERSFTVELVHNTDERQRASNFAKFGDYDCLGVYVVVNRSGNLFYLDKKSYVCTRKYTLDWGLPEELKNHPRYETSLICSCCGKYMALVILYRYLMVIDVETTQTVYRKDFDQKLVSCIDFLDEHRLVVGVEHRCKSFVVDFYKDRLYELPVVAPIRKVVADRDDRSFYLIYEPIASKFIDKGDAGIVIDSYFGIGYGLVEDALIFNYGRDKYIALSIYDEGSTRYPNNFDVYDLNSYQHVFGIMFPNNIEAVGVSPDKRYLAIVFRENYRTYIAVAELDELFNALA
jgi:hypothetical protein